MIYTHVKSGRSYQYYDVGFMVINGGKHQWREPMRMLDGVPVVIARDPDGNHLAYLEDVYDEFTCWRKIADGALLIEEGTYIKDGDKLIVYRGEDGTWWVRPEAEFFDGRFEAFNDVRKAA